MHYVSPTLTIIGSDNGLSPVRRHTIIWTNAVLLFIGPIGTKFSQIVFEMKISSFKKMHLNMSGKCCPFGLSLNVLNEYINLPKPNNAYMGHDVLPL